MSHPFLEPLTGGWGKGEVRQGERKSEAGRERVRLGEDE